MIEPKTLLSQLTMAVTPMENGDGLRVSTHCLYPSNGVVTVLVRGGNNSFVVSDEGGALHEIGASGRLLNNADRFLKRLVKPQGLHAQNGAIYSPMISAADVVPAILLVANASKEVADWGMSNIKFKASRNFREDLAALLGRHFRDNLKHDLPILGASNKPHRFRHIIYLSRDRRLLIDPAVNGATSINARVVANMDVQKRQDPNILQLIVYDDSEAWDSSQLKVLGFGAPTVPFKMAEKEIIRLSA